MNTRWANLSARDRRVLACGAALAAVLLFWALAWTPLAASRATLREQAVANEEALAWMRPAVRELAARGGAALRRPDGRSLLARVDAGVREAGLGGSLIGLEPQGARQVRVQFGGADFDVLVAWLERQAAAGIGIEELSIQRASGAGRVDARVSLREGGA